MDVVNVNLGKRSYDIEIGTPLEQIGSQLTAFGFARKIGLVTNPTIGNLHGLRIIEGLKSAGYQVVSIEVPDGEEYKTLDWANHIYTALLTNGFDRKCALVALGGGVIGDLTGFAAATFMRGISFIQVPTTLLAMVDSSVGGKTGVNHSMGKNMIGAFYQPKKVCIDLSTLLTLPKQEFISGMAEVVKYGVIRDPELFEYLEKNRDNILDLETGAVGHIVTRSCQIKADVVGQDETEQGVRAILNYGHTIGHAIETAENYTRRHGEAVAIGMVCAARLSFRLGLCDKSVPDRIEQMLKAYGLPTDFSILARKPLTEELLETIKIDKKAEGGKVRFILPTRIGEVIISKEWSERALREVLSSA